MSNLNKAKNMYHDKNKEYERCAEAVRIAEQAAELGAAGEGKVDKRKRLEEEALAKTMDYKAVYMQVDIRTTYVLFLVPGYYYMLRIVVLMSNGNG